MLARGARLGGWATFAVVVGNVLCVLLWAPRIDSLGRRHTIVRSLGGLALGLMALAGAARLDAVALSLGAYVVMAATSATQAAAAALASDSAEKDARQKTALAVVIELGERAPSSRRPRAIFFVLPEGPRGLCNTLRGLRGPGVDCGGTRAGCAARGRRDTPDGQRLF